MFGTHRLEGRAPDAGELGLGRRRLAKARRTRALPYLASEDLADHRKREHVRHDERQCAVLVQLAQLVSPQIAELLFVDHLKAAVNERLFASLRLDGDFAL